MDFISRLRALFTPPTADIIAVRQLEETRRDLLQAHAYREEAESLVRKYEARVRRLEAAVRGEKE